MSKMLIKEHYYGLNEAFILICPICKYECTSTKKDKLCDKCNPYHLQEGIAGSKTIQTENIIERSST
jgi:hypothetical protein